MNIKYYCICSWILFWLGHLVSKIMNYGPLGRLYPVYNKLMLLSCDLSDKGNCNIWRK